MKAESLPAALLIDLDGTLYSGDEPLPGALRGMRRLDECGVPRRFLTNTTRMSRAALAERLQEMGFEISPGEIFTAPLAARGWLRGRGIERVALYLPESTRADFAGLELDDEAPQAVVVGDLGDEWTFMRLDRAFRQLLDGAELVALQKNRFWNTGERLALDAGPFVVALEYASGREATVVGKPSAEFFRLGALSMGVDPGGILVIGDDVEADIRGAQGAGMRGALVRTGKFRPELLERSGVQPDLQAADFGELVEMLLSGRREGPL